MFFVTIEGGEGGGKTTNIKHLKELFENKGYRVLVTREPGGVSIAEQIRNVILNKESVKMDAKTEVLLYAAARRQHLIEKVIPHLEKGYVVISDRYVDSSIVYQGIVRGVGISEVLKINEMAIDGYWPDLTLIFDVEPKIGLGRIFSNEKREKNRFDEETLDFHEKVRDGYRKIAHGERFVFIDANGDEESVKREVETATMKFIDRKGGGGVELKK